MTSTQRLTSTQRRKQLKLDQAWCEAHEEKARREAAFATAWCEALEENERWDAAAAATVAAAASARAGPLMQCNVRLEHALALQDAFESVAGVYFPADVVRRVLHPFRPLCYLCSLWGEERRCYMCSLGWWQRFERLIEEHDVKSIVAQGRKSRIATQKPAPAFGMPACTRAAGSREAAEAAPAGCDGCVPCLQRDQATTVIKQPRAAPREHEATSPCFLAPKRQVSGG